MSLSTHVLDASLGRPAQGVPIQLRTQGDAGAATIFTAVTDADGRYRHQQAGADLPLAAGIYDLQFDTAAYFTATAQTGFYPRVTVTFTVTFFECHARPQPRQGGDPRRPGLPGLHEIVDYNVSVALSRCGRHRPGDATEMYPWKHGTPHPNARQRSPFAFSTYRGC